MAKRTNDKKIKVNINPQQKAMLSAVQAEPVEKVDETVAANENEPESEVELNKHGKPKKGLANTPSPDGRTKDQRRADRIALRDKALEEALAQNLPFFEGYPAIEFEKDYEKAFKDATTCEKAVPADTIRAAKAKIAESLAKTKTPTQELVEAAKAAVTPTTEEPEDDKPDNTPVAVIADGKEFIVTAGGDLVGEREIGETTTVTYDGVEYVLDSKGELVRNDGESSKKFGNRKHSYKRAKWLAEKAEKTASAETESRNGEPPTASDVNKTIPVELDGPQEEVVTPPVNSAEESATVLANAEDEIKVCDDLVKESEAAKTPLEQDIAAMETKVTDEPEANSGQEQASVADTPDAAPTEQPNDATTNPDAKPAEQEQSNTVDASTANSTPVVEQKPEPTKVVTKPTVVVDNTKKQENKGTERTPEQIAAAKKFYGSAWNAERATALANAHYWLTRAVDAEQVIRGIASPNGKLDPRTAYRLAMNSAFKFECEAFGGSPHMVTVSEVNEIYGMPEEKGKAA